MLWIGLMSGTSADAIDAVAVRIGREPSEIELVGAHEEPIPDALRARIHALVQGAAPLRELLALDAILGELFATAAHGAARAAGVRLEDVFAIASHGQTVAHYPEPGVHNTLQIGSAALIHARTGRPVVSDFRRADMAAGGQGAPLTPFFHFHRFADAKERRAVLNIGGFTNVSYLPDRDPARVIAFDPGPGNALLDRAARWASGGRERYDRDGARAARGRVHGELLEEWLADPYFTRPPPKSTGHEHFGEAFFARARDAVLARGGAADDVFASSVAAHRRERGARRRALLPGAARALDPVRRRRPQPDAGARALRAGRARTARHHRRARRAERRARGDRVRRARPLREPGRAVEPARRDRRRPRRLSRHPHAAGRVRRR